MDSAGRLSRRRTDDSVGGTAVTDSAKTLAQQSHIPLSQLTLVSRQGTYAHNDPAAAYPHNVFFSHLVPFLAGLTLR